MFKCRNRERIIYKFSAVTTFNLNIQPYGLELIESFYKFWPEDIILYVFLENGIDKIDDAKVKRKIKLFDYKNEIPQYYQFCEKFKHMQKKQDNYRLNAFKFAYKVFAMQSALSKICSDYLIWLDADIRSAKPITNNFLNKLVDKEKYMSYLGRSHVLKENVRYSENGFTIFNIKHQMHKLFWEKMDKMYMGGKLFNLSEWHDSYVFDQVREDLEENYNLKNFNISDLGIKNVGNESHVFVASILGDFMDHKKGNRKQKKWSPEFIKRYNNSD